MAFTGPMGLFWVAHEQKVWTPCKVASVAGDLANLSTDEGEVLTCPVHALQGLAQVLDEQVYGVDDVCSLGTVNEAALLHTVRVRYFRKLIYTRVSRILISVNPFSPLPIYSASHLLRYAHATDSFDLPPHIFGIGHDAMRGLRESPRDQAIVISGESGAGKTEAAKLLLSYVAEVVRSTGGVGGICGLEEQVMQTNPVLEAFGNAMTTRNNNSSRFGKWLDMRFSACLGMQGCRITSYLLEVTRVCGQMEGERGYHIFFQLLQARDTPLLRDLHLQELCHYRYLKSSTPVAPGVDDARCFAELQGALTALGFSEAEQLGVFRIAMGSLALGNADFSSDTERCHLQDKADVQHAAELLGVDTEALAMCMIWRKVVTGKDVTTTPLRAEQARAVRDGLSRMLYGSLFEWLIRRMNCQLHTGGAADASGDAAVVGTPPADTADGASPPATEAQAATVGADRLLGILDISGFESFERNSLEQLLINLSNEHLQLQFNDHVFRAELEDCAKEGIKLEHAVNYADNSDCVALIDGRGGVLDMLDEEITVPKATDLTFSAKVVRGHTKHPRLVAPKFAGVAIFGVQHYAGCVQYSCDGFLEKNADRQPSEDVVGLLLASSLPEMQAVAGVLAGQLVCSAKAKRAKSATSRFRTSLRSLICKISAADNHYVRCIKPNFEKVPEHFTSRMVHEQLLFSGVLEAVRIRQRGYSSRLPFRDFLLRYRCVIAVRLPGDRGPRPTLPGTPEDTEGACRGARELVARLCGMLAPATAISEFAFGTSKVFMKATASSVLESARAKACHASVIHIQRLLRKAWVRRKFLEARPVMGDIYAWMCRWSPDLAFQRGEEASASGALLQRMGRLDSAEHELAFLASRLQQAAGFSLDFGILSRVASVERRLREEVEALRNVRGLLRGCSINADAMAEALARARRLGIPVAHDMLELTQRLDRLRAQMPLVEALEEAVSQRNFERLPRVIAEAERLGCRVGGEGWLAELEGARLLTEAVRLVEEEEARKQKELEMAAAAAAAEAAKIAEEARAAEAAKTRQLAAPPAQDTMVVRRGAALEANGRHLAEEGASSDGTGADLEVVTSLADRLAAMAARIKGVPLGNELAEIAEALQAAVSQNPDGSGRVHREAVAELTARLAAAAGRIRGVPLGEELAGLAYALETEVGRSRATGSRDSGVVDRPQPSGTTAAMLAELHVLDKAELRRTVMRLAEEKEQLRSALQSALLSAMQREEVLRDECEALRRGGGVHQNGTKGACNGAKTFSLDFASANPKDLSIEALREHFSVALEEEARAARAARAHLVAENAQIKSELAAEQVMTRVLRTELAAVRAMCGNGRGKRAAGGTESQFPTTVASEELHVLRAAHSQLAAEHARMQSEFAAERAASRALRSELAGLHTSDFSGIPATLATVAPPPRALVRQDSSSSTTSSGGLDETPEPPRPPKSTNVGNHTVEAMTSASGNTSSKDNNTGHVVSFSTVEVVDECETPAIFPDYAVENVEPPQDPSASSGRRMSRAASFARRDFTPGLELEATAGEDVLGLCRGSLGLVVRHAAQQQPQARPHTTPAGGGARRNFRSEQATACQAANSQPRGPPGGTDSPEEALPEASPDSDAGAAAGVAAVQAAAHEAPGGGSKLGFSWLWGSSLQAGNGLLEI